MTGVRPYYNCTNVDMRTKVQAGENPERPSGMISDAIWSVLEECWSKIPAKRPPIVKLYNAMSNDSNRLRFAATPQKRPTKELPRKLHLHFLCISPPKGYCPYLKLKYGKMSYRTFPTTHEGYLGENSWHVYAHFCPLPCH